MNLGGQATQDRRSGVLGRLAGAMMGAIGLLAVATPAHAVINYAVTTGTGGTADQIDVDHSLAWTFTAISGWYFAGGNFDMKDSSSSTGSLTLSLYQGTNSSGTLDRTLTLTQSQFCTAHGGTCTNFAMTQFGFSLYNLTNGATYYAQLTSTALDSSTTSYYIDGLASMAMESFSSSVLAGQTLTTTYTSPSTGTPEPMTLGVLSVGLAGISMVRRRKRG